MNIELSEPTPTVTDLILEVKNNVEKDGKKEACLRLKQIIKLRGKFKISEKQFIDQMTDMWVGGELSATERILRLIELDKDLDSKDMIVGEIQLFLHDVFKILKRRLNLKENVTLDDLIWGKFSTEKVMESNCEQKPKEEAEAIHAT